MSGGVHAGDRGAAAELLHLGGSIGSRRSSRGPSRALGRSSRRSSSSMRSRRSRPQDVRGACAISALLCLPVSLALGFIGVSAKFLFPEMKSLYAFPVFLNHLSPLLSGVVMVSIIASILVAVRTVVVAASALIVRDFYVPMFKPAPERELRVPDCSLSRLPSCRCLLVIFAPQVLHLSFFTRALRLAVTVVAVFAFYFHALASNRGATLGLVGAAVTTTVGT